TQKFPERESFMRFELLSSVRPLCHAVVLATGLAIGFAGAAAAQQEGMGEDPVVATVNGSEIRYSDVIRSAQDLPAQYQQNLMQVFPALVQRLVDMRLMEQQGREDGLEENERVQAR